jgi:hypothetical protein
MAGFRIALLGKAVRFRVQNRRFKRHEIKRHETLPFLRKETSRNFI